MCPREDSAEPDLEREPDTSVGPLPTRPERPRSAEGAPRRPGTAEARRPRGGELPFADEEGPVGLSDKPTPRRSNSPETVPEEHTQATAFNPLDDPGPSTDPGILPGAGQGGDTSVTALPPLGAEDEATGLMDMKALLPAPSAGNSPAVPWETSPGPAPRPEPSGVGRKPTNLGSLPAQREPSGVIRRPTSGEVRAPRRPTSAEAPAASDPSITVPTPRLDVGRKGTRGEIPVQSEPSLGSGKKPTRAEVPVQAEPSQPGLRKPTRGELPAQNEPSLGSGKKPTRAEVPTQSEPSQAGQRKPTRGEIPAQKAPPAAEKSKPAPPVEDEDTGTKPLDRREVEREVAEKSQPGGRFKRPKLSEQATGVVVLSEIMQSKPEQRFEVARPKAAPGAVSDEDTSSISIKTGEVLPTDPGERGPPPRAAPKAAPKPKGEGALGKLKELTGFHKLEKLTGIHKLRHLTGTGIRALNELPPSRKLGFQVAVAGAMVLGGLGLTIHMFTRTDLPNEEQLQVLYPYGFTGGVQPNGRTAPGATDVTYTFQETVECGSSLCQKFEVTGRDGVFRLVMTVSKDESGNWVRVGGGPR